MFLSCLRLAVDHLYYSTFLFLNIQTLTLAEHCHKLGTLPTLSGVGVALDISILAITPIP